MSGKMKKRNLQRTYVNELMKLIKTELSIVHLTTDDKKFLNQHKALIHESELQNESNQNRRWEQMKTKIAELVCKTLKEKQWGIFFKHEPVQALPVQDNTVLYKVNEVNEDELVEAIKQAIEASTDERNEEWQRPQQSQNQKSERLSNGMKTISEDTKE